MLMFGTKYMAMLYGFAFFSHQVGGFLGVWLGGVLYEAYGSYDLVWWLSVALGIASALINLPIEERPVERPRRGAGGVARTRRERLPARRPRHNPLDQGERAWARSRRSSSRRPRPGRASRSADFDESDLMDGRRHRPRDAFDR